MQIIDGKIISARLKQRISESLAEVSKRAGRRAGLAVVLIGEDPASQIYVASKIKTCQDLGIESFEVRLPATINPQELKHKIATLNQDPRVDGILIQLPLPKSLSEWEVLNWVDPKKDADCLTAENLGLLWCNRPRTIPCTPSGVMALLRESGVELSGLNCAVVGRSEIVGKPMAHLLTQADATVTLCHSRTRDLRRILRQMDLVVVAAGKPEFLGREDFKEGSVIIDVGIHRLPTSNQKTRICGDVRFKELEGHVRAATPVPGGVGPMTIAMLMENTLRLFELRSKPN